MRKNVEKLIIVAVPVVVLGGLFALRTYIGGSVEPIAVEAYGDSVPLEPHIVFLAQPDASRGAVDAPTMEARGATSAFTWEEARLASQEHPMDAILVDQAIIANATNGDLGWLRQRYEEGVAVVGLGVNDNDFAQILGLETIRVSGEADVPIGASGYRLVYGLVLGHPDDLKDLGNWVDQLIRGEEPQQNITHPMIQTFGTSRGELNSDADLDLLFTRLGNSIADVYQTRADFRYVSNETGR